MSASRSGTVVTIGAAAAAPGECTQRSDAADLFGDGAGRVLISDDDDDDDGTR